MEKHIWTKEEIDKEIDNTELTDEEIKTLINWYTTLLNPSNLDRPTVQIIAALKELLQLRHETDNLIIYDNGTWEEIKES